MTEQHSIVGPSGLSAMIKCPGKVRMEQDLPDETSFAAAEGTVAHKVAEHKLLSPATAPVVGTVFKQEGHEITVDQEMIDAVRVYINEIEGIRAETADLEGIELVEGKMTLEPFGIPDVWGTVDYALSLPFAELYVRDYKHGQGVVVDPEDNPQLMAYALGAAGDMIDTYTTINIGIVQPRGRSGKQVKTWKTTPAHLKAWAEDVLKPAVALALSDDAPINPGDDQCRFCRAKATCPAMAEQAIKTAQADFTDFAMIQAVKPDDVATLTIEQVADVYKKLPLLKSFIKSVELFVFNELSAGRPVPGYKLVNGKRSRDWADVEKAEKYLCRKLGKDGAFTRKLLTIPQAEKVMDETSKKYIEKETVWSTGKPVIAVESDKREPVCTAIDDFKDFAEIGDASKGATKKQIEAA